MREGSGLVEYSRAHPERYIDVGIAEDVAVTVAAGLALRGERPIVAIYSSFLQRGFDQVVHDVCIENLDVIFAIDRAGLVGGDGATHQGIYDVSYLRAIPNLSVAMPKDATEMRGMLKSALQLGGPKAIRWPRGGVERAPQQPMEAWEAVAWGTWEILKPGSEVAVLAMGPTVAYALEAASGDERVEVVNARFVKPLDHAMLHRLAGERRALVTVEDHTIMGGLGSAVSEALADAGLHLPVIRLGIPDVTVPHGDPGAQHEAMGYGPAGIRAALEGLGLARPSAAPGAADGAPRPEPATPVAAVGEGTTRR
jgi:1-deoxy-D-xylulose-5-phosphate synthase